MQSHARSGAIALRGSPDVDLIYVFPAGDWQEFEAALRSLAARFIGRVRLIKAAPERLWRLTRAHIFLSKSVPNVVVVRCGEVVAHTVGALPMTELKAILASVTRRLS